MTISNDCRSNGVNLTQNNSKYLAINNSIYGEYMAVISQPIMDNFLFNAIY